MTSTSWKRSSNSPTSAVMPARLPTMRHQSRPEPWRSETASPSVSIGVRSANNWLIWKVRAMPSCTRRCGSRLVIDAPSSRISPPDGRSMPVSRLTRVVLPAPLGPIRAWRAPLRIVIEMALAATMPPNRLSRFLVSRTGTMIQTLANCRFGSGPNAVEPDQGLLLCQRYALHQDAASETEHEQARCQDEETPCRGQIEPDRRPDDQDRDDAAIDPSKQQHHDENEPDSDLPIARSVARQEILQQPVDQGADEAAIKVAG